MFIIPLKSFENSLLTGLKILVGILLGPLALFVFIETVLTFSGSIYERWVFVALTMFLFIISAILVKKLLKWLEICLKCKLRNVRLRYVLNCLS